MRRVIAIVIGVLALVLVGIVTVLATWTVPDPVAPVEKQVPDDRLPK